MMSRPASCLLALLSFAVLTFFVEPLQAQPKPRDLRDHFEEKTITIIHGSSPGGGYDLIARALAKVLPNHLPGKPSNVIVQPRPGGGPFRLNALRALVRARPDGLTIGNAYVAWVVAETIGEGAQGFKLSDLRPLGTPIGSYSDNIACANPQIAKSWQDIENLGRPILWGGIAPGISGHLVAPPWLAELGAPIKLVWGYGGTTEMSAAFRRGETELVTSCAGTLYRDYPDWANSKNVAPIFWVGKPHPATQDILKKMGIERPPHVFEVAKKYIKAEWQKDALDAGLSLARISRAYFVPAGVPSEIYNVWSDTFRNIVNDPKFAESLHPVYREQLAPMYADEMSSILEKAEKLDPRTVKLLKILVEGHGK